MIELIKEQCKNNNLDNIQYKYRYGICRKNEYGIFEKYFGSLELSYTNDFEYLLKIDLASCDITDVEISNLNYEIDKLCKKLKIPKVVILVDEIEYDDIYIKLGFNPTNITRIIDNIIYTVYE